jgi:hypothetical protein
MYVWLTYKRLILFGLLPVKAVRVLFAISIVAAIAATTRVITAARAAHGS